MTEGSPGEAASTGAAPLRRTVRRSPDLPREHRAFPCTRCPWRTDTDLSDFTDEDMAMLRRANGRPGDEAALHAPTVACHLNYSHPATAACAAHGQPWPDTFTVATPSGGRHLYFRAPPVRTVLSSSGGVTHLGPGIDVRAPGRRSGSYLIGPGSVVAGTEYTVVRDTGIAPLPSWLGQLLTPTRPLKPKAEPMRRIPSDHER